MEFLSIQKHKGIATLTLTRGKVNALNGQVVDIWCSPETWTNLQNIKIF